MAVSHLGKRPSHRLDSGAGACTLPAWRRNPAMANVFIALGSNIEPEANLRTAFARLAELVRVTAVSAVYRTPPWGEPGQPDFLNAVVAAASDLAPLHLLEGLLSIETRLHRKRGRRWGPRTADLDLLSFENRVLESTRLTLPHPRLHERAFVLLPWSDLAPDFVVPGLGKSVRELLAALDHTGIEGGGFDLEAPAPPG